MPKIDAVPLKRGTWLHQLLEAYANGQDWKKLHKKLTADFNRLWDEEKEYYGSLPDEVGRIMKAYVRRWRDEDADMTLLGTEVELAVKLPHGHILEVKIDRVTQDEYGTWIWEHKSHGKFPTATYRFTDVQSAIYSWALERDGRFGPITGVLWDYLRTKPPTVPQLLKPRPTKKDPNPAPKVSRRKIDTDYYTYVRALKSYGVDLREYRDVIIALRNNPDSFFRRERVPRPKKVVETLVKEMIRAADEMEKGVKPIRTIDRSCEWGCSYMNVCMTELYGGDANMIIKANFKQRESHYADEEKILEEAT